MTDETKTIEEPETENVTTELTDDEIALVVLGLTRIARARSTQIHSLSQVEASKNLLDKLGFPFAEPTEVLPEGETEYPIKSNATADSGASKEA